ncbi:hypothetical protein LOC71_01675 [Rhodopirellula sp. JC740]|uniref:Uncharacterized protein n=1 Tax=Rhodopirellula halodulae TaxID=2894198 RepID=A0ABS8NBN2_9BACT|nr:DUF6666 family protein [Rhodopirellula sp. JC740]MCC9640965.1 hypothetical protein [Rhodopirellula sp. JC740]
MITIPRRLLCLIAGHLPLAILAAATVSQTVTQSPLAAADKIYLSRPAPTSHAQNSRATNAWQPDSRTAKQPVAKRQIAKQQSVKQPVAKPMNGSVRPVSFVDGGCDCAACASGGVLGGPGCGMEASCGFEVGCGLEEYGVCSCDACSGQLMSGCDSGFCDSGFCDGGCDGMCGGAEIDCFPLFLPILRVDWSRFSFFAGSQAFKSPMNYPALDANGQPRGGSGSFGFYQGFNEGRDLRNWLGLDLSAQLGVRATQTNLEGEEFTSGRMHQVFVTGGLFRRVDYGLQYGLVVDYMNQDWYYQSDLVQLRGELSWKASACHEFGFQFMAGVTDQTVTTEAGGFTSTEVIEPVDQYRAFYRRTMGTTGHMTAFLGGTSEEHFIWGSEMEIPLQTNWSLLLGSAYFSPGDDTPLDANESEGWNISLGFAFRPGVTRPKQRYRNPLFQVADNGSFFLFRR